MNSIYVVSGFSGSGKGTLIDNVCSSIKEVELVRSITTRPKRNEKDFYQFINTDSFIELEKKGLLLEHNGYNGYLYATPLTEVLRILNEGRSPLLEIDVNGFEQIIRKKSLPEDMLHSAFVVVNAKTLFERLTGRGTESRESIINRLKSSLDESEKLNMYDYVILNEDLNEAKNNIHNFFLGKNVQDYRNVFSVERFKKELEKILYTLEQEN